MAHDGEDLSGRDLSGADLSGSNFKGVDLSGADLHGATLQGVNFKNANLENADLSDADLSGANLKNATLDGADLDGATLTAANLKHAAFEEGESESDADDSLSSLVGSLVSGAVITLGVALLVAGWSEFWVVFVVGLLVVTPASIKLAEWYESRETGDESEANGETDEQQAALGTLRERYASGEIDEAEFERRVERLLETESVEDAETAYGSAGATDAELEQESEPTDTESEESSGTVDAEPEKEPE